MKKIKIYLMIALLSLTDSALHANANWMKTFKNLYKPAPDSELAASKCAVCHNRPNGKGGLNCYGKMLVGKPISEAALKAIESANTGADGVSNIAKIKAGKPPANAKCRP